MGDCFCFRERRALTIYLMLIVWEAIFGGIFLGFGIYSFVLDDIIPALGNLVPGIMMFALAVLTFKLRRYLSEYISTDGEKKPPTLVLPLTAISMQLVIAASCGTSLMNFFGKDDISDAYRSVLITAFALRITGLLVLISFIVACECYAGPIPKMGNTLVKSGRHQKLTEDIRPKDREESDEDNNHLEKPSTLHEVEQKICFWKNTTIVVNPLHIWRCKVAISD